MVFPSFFRILYHAISATALSQNQHALPTPHRVLPPQAGKCPTPASRAPRFARHRYAERSPGLSSDALEYDLSIEQKSVQIEYRTPRKPVSHPFLKLIWHHPLYPVRETGKADKAAS
jgi:hypothetical protein